jgi:antitoxin ParD1/3/4
MQTMNISLPDQLMDFVEEQLRSGRYRSASEYVRDLIHEDAMRKAHGRLEALLQEGLRSGVSEMTATDWSDIRREALTQFEERQSRKQL